MAVQGDIMLSLLNDRPQFYPSVSIYFISAFSSPLHNKKFTYPKYKSRIISNRMIEKHIGMVIPELTIRDRR
jgi:hypothetical protein